MPLTLQKDERVLKGADFRRALRQGKRFRAPHLMVVAVGKSCGRVRLGLTVSRKIGNAVVRNRVKRRLRELTRLNRSRLSNPWDLIVIVHPGVGGLSFHALEAEFLSTLEALVRFECSSAQNQDHKRLAARESGRLNQTSPPDEV